MPDLEALRRDLEDREDILLAVLFGSRAEGRERPASDIDLGVLLEPSADRHLSLLQGELSRKAGGEVDLVDMATAPPLLRFKIAQNGHPLVLRDRADWVRFRAKAMIDWYDWQPTARRMWMHYRRRLKESMSSQPQGTQPAAEVER